MFSLSTVKKQWNLLNKRQFDKAIIQVTWSDENEDMSEKNLQVIIDTFVGYSSETTSNDAAKILISEIQQINPMKWQKALKTLSLTHYILNMIPSKITTYITELTMSKNTFIADLSLLTHKSSTSSSSTATTHSQQQQQRVPVSSTQQGRNCAVRSRQSDGFTIVTPELRGTRVSSKDSLHIGLVAKYFVYLSAYNDRIETIAHLCGSDISNCRAFMKEHSKIKSVMQLFPAVQHLQRELEAVISTYKKVSVTQRIACSISNNLMRVYSMLKHVIERILNVYESFESHRDFVKFFTFYSDFIQVTKNLMKFNALPLAFAQPTYSSIFSRIELYAIDKELNRKIELHHLGALNKISPSNENNSNFYNHHLKLAAPEDFRHREEGLTQSNSQQLRIEVRNVSLEKQDQSAGAQASTIYDKEIFISSKSIQPPNELSTNFVDSNQRNEQSQKRSLSCHEAHPSSLANPSGMKLEMKTQASKIEDVASLESPSQSNISIPQQAKAVNNNLLNPLNDEEIGFVQDGTRNNMIGSERPSSQSIYGSKQTLMQQNSKNPRIIFFGGKNSISNTIPAQSDECVQESIDIEGLSQPITDQTGTTSYITAAAAAVAERNTNPMHKHSLNEADSQIIVEDLDQLH